VSNKIFINESFNKLSLDEQKEIYHNNVKNILNVKIYFENIKGIKKLEEPFELKLDNSLYVIIGENGVGKSTLMTTIGQLLNHNSLKNEFKGKGFENSYIEYILNDMIYYRWEKKSNWILTTRNEIQTYMLKIRGFFESSIVSGTRFNHLSYKNKFLSFIDEKNDLKSFIDKFKKEEIISKYMSDIMCREYNIYSYNFNFKYRKEVTDGDKKYEMKSKSIKIYGNLKDDKFIPEFLMSGGEYFLLNLFKFLANYLKNKSEKKLIVIDEIELALHPRAIRNLVKIINNDFLKNNFTFIIATHSLPVIYSASANNLIYLKMENGIMHFEKGKKAGFLASYIDEKLALFDRLILVEDILALEFIEYFIKNDEILNYLSENVLFQIIPLGGWNEVLNFATWNKYYSFLKSNNILILLDGDVKKDKRFIERNENEKIEKELNIDFLPFLNIENLFTNELLINENFKNKVKNVFLKTKNFDEYFRDLNMNASKTKEYKANFRKFKEKLQKFPNITEDKIYGFLFDYILNEYLDEKDKLKFKERLEKFLNK
jgi:predicted ATPase